MLPKSHGTASDVIILLRLGNLKQGSDWAELISSLHCVEASMTTFATSDRQLNIDDSCLRMQPCAAHQVAVSEYQF
jgi:hypothetical protein